MNELSNLTPALSVLSIIISIVLIIRWWRMTSDINYIKTYLSKKELAKSSVKETEVEFDERVERLKIKMLPNQCIVKVLANSNLEIWNNDSWDQIAATGKLRFYEQVYKNY